MASSQSSMNVASSKGYRPLEGKIAIITGASRGIGAAIAHNLGSKGASLVLNFTSDSSASITEELSKQLAEKHQITTLPVKAEMGTPAGANHLITAAKNHFSKDKIGPFQIDIIINNAGVSKNTPLGEIDISDYEWQYKINVLGPLLLMQAALPHLPHDRSGRVVNVSSVSSSAGFVGQTVYGGTKAALEAMTRTWARELAERATVNAVNPGPVNTDMWAATTPEFKEGVRPFIQTTPLSAIRHEVDDKSLVEGAKDAGGRPAYVDEIAGVVGMLCTADSAWCTGQTVCANGGLRFAI